MRNTTLLTSQKARERCIASYNRCYPATVRKMKAAIEGAADKGLYTVSLPADDNETVEYLRWHGFEVALHMTHSDVPMGTMKVSWWLK